MQLDRMNHAERRLPMIELQTTVCKVNRVAIMDNGRLVDEIPCTLSLDLAYMGDQPIEGITFLGVPNFISINIKDAGALSQKLAALAKPVT